MAYTILGQDDEKLRVTFTVGAGQTILTVQPAALTIVGAVTSVNGQTGAVQLELGLTESEVDARVQLGIDGLIDGAPGTLDTLNELAAALNDDEAAYDTLNNLISTNSNNIALKLNTSDFTSTANSWLETKTTSDLTEGTNLYYTDARVNTFLTDGSVTSINFGGNTSLTWNADDGTLEFPVNADVTLQIGQENLIHVKNLSGTTLTNGTVLRVTGASRSKLTVDLANNTSDAVSADTIAIMTQELGNNGVGYATTEGLVRGLDTSAYTEGAVLWLDGAGVFTQTKPLTPAHLVQVGYVVRSHATEGSIFVSIKNGWELDELHDVLISSVSDGQGIVWDAANGYWKNDTITVDLTGYATEAYVDAAVFSGDYNDLINQPTIPTVPTNVSAFTNDAGYATTAYVDSQAHFSGDYNDLINTPTIPAEYTDADAVNALETATDLTFTGNLTVEGDFVVQNKLKSITLNSR